jgi:hypothetical protein
MHNAYVGFYWTLPVNWAGFRRLPANVDDAAAASLTIRYQREVVRRYVVEDRGTLLDEIGFIDVQPDRATDMVQAELRTKAATYAGRATLLYVRFEEIDHWRRNAYLLEAARELGLEVLPLPPDPVSIDGETFNPILHFKQWRERDESTKTRLKLEAGHELRLALAKVPEGNGRWQVIAERLNNAGTWTSSGGRWTAENVRKHASRLQ